MLTGPQQQTLKTFIANTSALNSVPNTLDGAWEIATLLNLVATPYFIVWKTNVAIDEIMRNGMDWARVDNLSVGKARIWEWMTKLNTINAAKPNIRAGIDAAWVGTAADLAVRAAVYVHCKRTATVVEKLFATGTGSDASPATMVLEGAISPQDVYDARNAA